MEHKNSSDWEQAQLSEELLEQELRQAEFAEDSESPSAPETNSDVKPKHPWQLKKESWYDKLNVSVRQLDIIIGAASIALLVVFILIFLDAAGLR